MNKKEYKEKIQEFFLPLIKNKKYTKEEFEEKKAEFAKKYGLSKMPLTSEILNNLDIQKRPKFLVTKPSRTQSGVTVVAIMSKPYKCPGNCIYCPSAKNAPKSYTGFEPAAMRAERNKFSAYKQIKDRLKQFRSTGHPTKKIELIIMGGTFPAMPYKYQQGFIKEIYQAITNSKNEDLNVLKKSAMRSKTRLIGITFETRPDYCSNKTIERLLDFGGTRIELGVQITNNKVLDKVNRGHGVKEVVDATQRLKDAGFKVLYHIMPGLPGSNYKKDLKHFKELFKDSRFCPDMIKIYPCLVTKNTKIEKMLYNGEYTPYSTKQAIKLIADMKEHVPKWVRIMRIQRDIPATKIVAGVKKSNLRQLVQNELKRRSKKCKCIRCCEPKDKLKDYRNYKIKQIEYKASKGKEYFIYAEKKDYLLGFIRLRFPHDPFMACIKEGTSLVRELHVYGKSTKFKNKNIQHIGIGKKLLKKAEDISKKNGFEKISVISGVGVREYYSKLGYYLDEPYISKNL